MIQVHFDEFLDSISLGPTQVKRIESASSTVTSFLQSHYGLPLHGVFLQGSYANGTAVKPVDGGEYDVDIICVCASEEQTPAAALRDLFEALDGNGLYSGKLVEKQPCVRIEYADDAIGSFHVDVVPARASAADAAPLDAPRRTSGWHPTAPREYTQWCEQQGDHFCRLVQMLKRWRDEHQDVRRAVKSIVLQVLLSEYIAVDAADDSQRVAQSIFGMNAALQPLTSPPIVLNPVLETENLAARWTSQAFADFKRKLSEAAEIASAAIHADDLVSSGRKVSR